MCYFNLYMINIFAIDEAIELVKDRYTTTCKRHYCKRNFRFKVLPVAMQKMLAIKIKNVAIDSWFIFANCKGISSAFQIIIYSRLPNYLGFSSSLYLWRGFISLATIDEFSYTYHCITSYFRNFYANVSKLNQNIV